MEDQAYAVALGEFESSLNSRGIPLEEAISAGAARDNRKGTHYYEAESVIDHSELAVEEHLKSFGDKDEYRAARIVRVRRVDR